MGKEPVKKSIDGLEYLFGRLPVKQSMKQLIKIVKIAGPAMGVVANGMDGITDLKSVMDSDLDYKSVIENICNNLDEEALDSITDVFMANILYNGQVLSDIFEAHFQEQGLVHLGKVVVEAAKAEYGSFFAGKLGESSKEENPGTNQE